MAAALFDTLIFSHKLMDAGMSRKQAEKIAEAQKEIFEAQNEVIASNLATKEDIWKLDKKLDLSIKEFEGKFNLLYWMIGFVLAFCVSIVFKLYF